MNKKRNNLMLKKILVAVGCLCLVGCGVEKAKFETSDFIKPEVKKTKTAVLLPLSGDSASLGDAFRNAILMAQ